MQENFKKIKSMLGSDSDIVLFILITLLVPVSLTLGLFGANNPKNWWQSVSAAYYCGPSKLFFIVDLFLIAFFMSMRPTIVEKLTTIPILGILLFPTYEKTLGLDSMMPVGIFNLPMEISGNIHIIFNAIVVVLIITIIILGYTSTNDIKYIFLCIPIFIGMIMIIIENIFHAHGNWSLHWTTIIAEWLIFQASALVFLVKNKHFRIANR